jgi:hypothetical protein
VAVKAVSWPEGTLVGTAVINKYGPRANWHSAGSDGCPDPRYGQA